DPPHDAERLRRDAELVAHRDADPRLADVERRDPHASRLTPGRGCRKRRLTRAEPFGTVPPRARARLTTRSRRTRYLDGPRPRLFAHRGAPATFPENTLEAFAAGLRAGADRLELDVHASADGIVMVIHDSTLERTTDGAGPVRSLPLAALERLDAGHR